MNFPFKYSDMQAANNSMVFRRDIQLLRAIAVVLVIAYHLRLPGFSNGFLGVDIFFVISGFLMERLYRPKDGAIAFYQRRAKRLLPPYFVTVWLVAISAIFLLLPEAVSRISEHLQASAVFSSNIYHWSEESYFTSAYFSPLLHFWSLALELQFYLIFPFLSDWTRAKRFRLPIIAVVSIVICLLVVTVSPKTSFFMMPLRLWEFTLGMIVARLEFRRMGSPAIAILGILFFIILTLPVSGTAPSILFGHPSLVAISCSLIIAIILAIGIPQCAVPSSLVSLGNVSYSLYLVHFPIIAIYHYHPFSGTDLGSGDPLEVITLLTLMIPATAVLYLLVERKADQLFRWSYVLASIISTLGLAALITPISERLAPPFVVHLSQSPWDREEARCGKFYRLTHWHEANCIYGSQQKRAVYLLGDSHSEMIAREVRNIAESQGFSIVMPKNRNDFFKPVEWHLQKISHYDIAKVIITWRDHEVDLDRIADLVRGIAQDHSVAVLLPQPELPEPGPLLTLHAYAEGRSQAVIEAKPYRERLQRISAAFAGIENVRIYDPSILCTQTCPLNAPNGSAYFFDSNHLTLTGASRLRPILMQALKSEK